jgi:hypothetical protein
LVPEKLCNEDGVFENTAYLSSSTDDPDMSNNVSTYSNHLSEPADLSIKMWSEQRGISFCQFYIYVIEIENLGPGTAYDIVMSDDLPYMFEKAYYSVNCNNAWIIWNGSVRFEELEAGGTIRVYIRVYGGAGIFDVPWVVNTANVDAGTFDPFMQNNCVALRSFMLRR